MLGLRFIGNGVTKLEEFPDPVPKDDWVVVKVEASALCGTDLPLYRAPKPAKCIPGHEIAGEVVEVDRPRYIKAGDRVIVNAMVGCGYCEYCRSGRVLFCKSQQTLGLSALNGGHAEYVMAPERNCFTMPDDVSYDVGVAIPDGVGVPHHVTRRMGITGKDAVAIFGAGPVGLGSILLVKFYGATVIVVEINDYRIKLAKTLGADYVLDTKKENVVKAIKELTKGRGPDKCLDCAGGTDITTNQALSTVKKAGKVAFIGHKNKATINLNQVIGKELEIFGSCGYHLGEHEEMVRLVQRGLEVEKMITHKFNLREAHKAYALFSEGNTGKVIINPWG